MKLRQRPEDFVVEEVTRLGPSRDPPGGDRPYGLYELWKRGLTTATAVQRVARAADIDPKRIRYCGMKDRHAVATQYITIFGEPVRALEGRGFRLTPLGRSAREAAPSEIEANRFRITVRDLSRDEAERLTERAAAYARTGFPNYFDDQRFGSARATGEFPGEAAARGDYEAALKLVIASWSREDPAAVKKRRRAIRAGWGDWRAVKAAIDRSSERSIVTYLVDHPRDFAGAFDRLAESLRSIVLSAFQSLVWNEMLSGVVRARWAHTWTRKGRYDEVAFFRPEEPEEPGAVETLRGLAIPFPHRSLKMKALRAVDLDAARALEASLEKRGLTLDSFRLRGLKKAYFWRGERKALAEVGGFTAEGPMADELNKDELYKDELNKDELNKDEFNKDELNEDELNEGRHAVVLAFTLPPGVYATMFVKAAAGPATGTVRTAAAEGEPRSG